MYLFSRFKTRRHGAPAGRRELSSPLVLDTPTSVRFLAGGSDPDHAGRLLSSPRTFPGARGPHRPLRSCPSCAEACGWARVPSSLAVSVSASSPKITPRDDLSLGTGSAGGWVDAEKSYEPCIKLSGLRTLCQVLFSPNF